MSGSVKVEGQKQREAEIQSERNSIQEKHLVAGFEYGAHMARHVGGLWVQMVAFA